MPQRRKGYTTIDHPQDCVPTAPAALTTLTEMVEECPSWWDSHVAVRAKPAIPPWRTLVTWPIATGTKMVPSYVVKNYVCEVMRICQWVHGLSRENGRLYILGGVRSRRFSTALVGAAIQVIPPNKPFQAPSTQAIPYCTPCRLPRHVRFAPAIDART